MRKLLQNKAVVAGLAAVALICVAGNFVRLPGARVRIAAARAPDPINPVPSSDFPLREPRQVERAFAEWRRQIPDAASGRDPFRPVRKRVVAAPASTNTPTARTSAPPVFVVQAISIEPGTVSAIVNRKLLATGDQLEGYVVDQINPREVWFRGPAGRVSAPIDRASRPAEAATNRLRAGAGPAPKPNTRN